jgi:hypothetical protein
MIGIPCHSESGLPLGSRLEAASGVSVGSKGVLVGAGVAVGTAVKVSVGTGVGEAVGWVLGKPEQAVRATTSKSRAVTGFFKKRSFLIPESK